VPDLIAHEGRSLAIGYELGYEEVPEVMKARSPHAGLRGDRVPDFGVEFVGVDEPGTVSREDERGFQDQPQVQISPGGHTGELRIFLNEWAPMLFKYFDHASPPADVSGAGIW
jgi:hypothetical protein